MLTIRASHCEVYDSVIGSLVEILLPDVEMPLNSPNSVYKCLAKSTMLPSTNKHKHDKIFKALILNMREVQIYLPKNVKNLTLMVHASDISLRATKAGIFNNYMNNR